MDLEIIFVVACLCKSKKLRWLHSVWHRIVSALAREVNDNFFIAYKVNFVSKHFFRTFRLKSFGVWWRMNQVNLESVTEWHLIQRYPFFPLKPLLRPRIRARILQILVESIVLSLLVQWLPVLTVEELNFTGIIHKVNHVFQCYSFYCFLSHRVGKFFFVGNLF